LFPWGVIPFRPSSWKRGARKPPLGVTILLFARPWRRQRPPRLLPAPAETNPDLSRPTLAGSARVGATQLQSIRLVATPCTNPFGGAFVAPLRVPGTNSALLLPVVTIPLLDPSRKSK